MKKLLNLITVAVIIFAMASCSGAKNVAYIKDAGEVDMTGYMQTTPLYDA